MKKANYSNAIVIEDEEVDAPDLTSSEIKSQFEKIFNEIRQNPDIEDLSLKGNWITAQELSILSDTISSHKELKILDLSYNDISVEAVPFLKKIILEHPNLNNIYLDYNKITDEFIEKLTSNNPDELNARIRQVEQISLAANLITEKGLQIAKSRLSADSALTILFSNNTDPQKEQKHREEIEAGKKEEMQLQQTVQEITQTSKPLIHSDLKTTKSYINIGQSTENLNKSSFDTKHSNSPKNKS